MKDKPKILVIDDEQKVLDLVGFRLQTLGYEVITATRGEDALPLVEKHRPDLVILDVTMPGVDGLTVCSRLKESDAFGSIPILMLTARSDVEDVNKAMTAGADDYIVKPYDATVLQMKIRQYIHRDKSVAGQARNDA